MSERTFTGRVVTFADCSVRIADARDATVAEELRDFVVPSKTKFDVAREAMDRGFSSLATELEPSLPPLDLTPPPAVAEDSFLLSFEWRRVRMSVLANAHGRCACCGCGANDGAVLHVDHIKPRKRFPDLALDPKNLQVLCEECNHGKGNKFSIDWAAEQSC